MSPVTDDDGVVQAAGGVVWRRGSEAPVEVLLVHRPRYDDWSLPKGKLEKGERHEDAARREVEEETGYRCRLGRELVETRYDDAKGRPKLVRYWEMTPEGGDGAFQPNDEIDDIAWVPLLEAGPRLSYRRDQAVLDDFTTGGPAPA